MMEPFERYVKFYEVIQNIVFGIKYFIEKAKDPEMRNLLNSNTRFKGIHSGKRCFILGNGPSLKDVNFAALKDEFVFTVNQANRNPDFPLLNSNYHIWIDPSFFAVDNVTEEFLNVMTGINTEGNRPVCFLPYDQKPFVKRFKIDEKIDIAYLYCHKKFYEGFKGECNLDGLMPMGFATVVQMAILVAIYMGFTEIIILGCDSTGIVVSVNSALKKNSDEDYGYSVNETEKKRMESLIEKNSLEHYAVSYANLFKYFRRITDYCNLKGVKLLNASTTTVLTQMPHVRIKEIEK